MLTVSRKLAKILTVGRKSRHTVETHQRWVFFRAANSLLGPFSRAAIHSWPPLATDMKVNICIGIYQNSEVI